MESVFVKIRWVLADPSDFFTKLKDHHHLHHAALYLVIMTFVSSMLNRIIHASSDWSLGLFSKFFFLRLPQVGTAPVQFAILSVVFTLILIFLSYLAAFLLKVWLRMFGVQATFTQSYQLLAFALTPLYVFGWVHWMVSLISWIWVFGLLVIGSRRLFDISRRKAWLLFTLPAVLGVCFLIAALVWLARLRLF